MRVLAYALGGALFTENAVAALINYLGCDYIAATFEAVCAVGVAIASWKYHCEGQKQLSRH